MNVRHELGMTALVAALALAGCSSKPPAADCAHAVSGAIDRMVEDAKARMPAAAAANVARVVPQMKLAITAACIDDKWAPEVIACVDRAASQHDLNECDKQLTPEQRKSEHKRDDEILKLAVQPQ